MLALWLFFTFLLCPSFGSAQSICTIDVDTPPYPVRPSLQDHSSAPSPLIYSYLVVPTEDGGFEPDLADTCDYSPSSLSWTVKLKTAAFHNGKPVTVRDVAFSVTRALSGLGESRKNLQGIILLDNDRIVFRLRRSDSNFMRRLAFIEILSADSDVSIGSGPYYVESQSKEKLILHRNSNFYGPIPKIERLIFQYIPDADRSIKRLLKHDTDLVPDAAGVEIPPSVSSDSNFRIREFFPGYNVSLIFNTRSKVFRELPNRQCVACAIDQILLNKPCDNHESENRKHLSFRLLLPNITEYEHIAKTLKSKLEILGYDIDLKEAEPNEMVSILFNEPDSWDAVLTEIMSLTIKEPEYWLSMIQSPSDKGILSHQRLSSLRAQLPLLIESERLQTYKEMQALIYREYLILPLFPQKRIVVGSCRINCSITFTTAGLRQFAREGEVVEK